MLFVKIMLESKLTLIHTVLRFLKKLKIELPYDPANPLLGIYPDKTKSGNVNWCSYYKDEYGGFLKN